MKKVLIVWLFCLGFSFFLGYVGIAIGIGSVYPPLYKVAAPFVCEDGQELKVDQDRYTWRPGTMMWTAKIYRTGPMPFQKEDCTTEVKLVAGAIYGLGIFVLFLPLLFFRKAARPAAEQQPGPSEG